MNIKASVDALRSFCRTKAKVLFTTNNHEQTVLGKSSISDGGSDIGSDLALHRRVRRRRLYHCVASVNVSNQILRRTIRHASTLHISFFLHPFVKKVFTTFASSLSIRRTSQESKIMIQYSVARPSIRLICDTYCFGKEDYISLYLLRRHRSNFDSRDSYVSRRIYFVCAVSD